MLLKRREFVRHLMYHQYPELFNVLLISEINRALRKAQRMGLTLVVRLNGTI